MNRLGRLPHRLAFWGRFVPLLATALWAAVSSARADELVQALASQQQLHGNLGDFYLVRLKEIQEIANNRRTATLEVITKLGTPPDEYASAIHTVPNIHQMHNLPPIDKPVLMRLRMAENDRVFIAAIHMSNNQLHYLDRGVPGDRFYDATVRLLFTRHGEIDRDIFYRELLELAGDDDPNVATLAARYIGSSLNIYANNHCPEAVLEAFSNYILERATPTQQQAMAAFFGRAKLPRDPQLIFTLLASGSNHVVLAVRSRFARERSLAAELAGTMSEAMLATGGSPVREHLLRVALAWEQAAGPLWGAAEALVVDAERLGVSQGDQALAAQVLAQIDPGRARGTVRDALHRLDSPAIYRFVYEQRMYDAVGTLIDTLRRNATRHNDTVLALLAALTRNTQPSGKNGWIAWWDELVQEGRVEHMVRERFIPADGTGSAIDGLLDRLGDNGFDQRRQAFERLSAIGPVANPRLEAALNHPDAEVAIAAAQLLAENERRMKPVIDRLYGR